jgi:hypothetical protein
MKLGKYDWLTIILILSAIAALIIGLSKFFWG